MAALSRPSQATYEVHEHVAVDTSDNQDHTFSGIMFPVKCRDLLPLHHLVINSVAIRGQLGPITVWVCNRKKIQPLQSGDGGASSSSSYNVSMNPRDWIKIYDKKHAPSPRKYQKLAFNTPVIVEPGQVVVLYIHSTLQGDEAIVYDNLRYRPDPRGRNVMRYFRNVPQRAYRQRTPVIDRCVEILPGRAHVSNVAFGTRPIWGWGSAWRDDREFVGRIEYGCVYRLWNPTCHVRFAGNFNKAVQTLLLCQRRYESEMSRLPDDCIYYILNMCRWDWFNDGVGDYQQHRRQLRSRSQALMETDSTSYEQAEHAPVDVPVVGGGSSSQCGRMRNAMVIEEQYLADGSEVDDEDDDAEYVEEDDEEDDDDDEVDDDSDAGNRNFFRVDAASDDESDDNHQD